jgi:hypothetical protein
METGPLEKGHSLNRRKGFVTTAIPHSTPMMLLKWITLSVDRSVERMNTVTYSFYMLAVSNEVKSSHCCQYKTIVQEPDEVKVSSPDLSTRLPGNRSLSLITSVTLITSL